jgi:putative lipase involved disintegration of autophagic bodies
MKSSDFDMENTHLQDLARMEKLLCLVMIVFVWCYKVSDYLDKHVKKITIKKHEHRMKSVFKYGLEDIANCLLNIHRKDYDEVVKIFVM